MNTFPVLSLCLDSKPTAGCLSLAPFPIDLSHSLTSQAQWQRTTSGQRLLTTTLIQAQLCIFETYYSNCQIAHLLCHLLYTLPEYFCCYTETEVRQKIMQIKMDTLEYLSLQAPSEVARLLIRYIHHL